MQEEKAQLLTKNASLQQDIQKLEIESTELNEKLANYEIAIEKVNYF